MSTKISALALVGALALSATNADAITFTQVQNDGDGTVTSLNPGAFEFAATIISNNNGMADITTQALATNLAAGPIKVVGSWNFSTQDVDGSAFDPFGFFVGSTFTQLSIDGLTPPAFHTGVFSFVVPKNTDWGFFALSTDGIEGSSSTSVFGDTTAVPLPAGALLLLTALGGLAATRRLKKTANAA